MKKLNLRLSFITATLLFSFCIGFNPTGGFASTEAVQAEAKRGGYQLIDRDEVWRLYQSEKDNAC